MVRLTTTSSTTPMLDEINLNTESDQTDTTPTHDYSEEQTLSAFGSHFLIINFQEKADRLAKMMHAISLQESQIAFTRNQLEALNKQLEENKTKIRKMQQEMDYYSKLTHLDQQTKASGMGFMAQQISIRNSQNTLYSNQIDEGTHILGNFLRQLDKMELEMAELRKLPVC